MYSMKSCSTRSYFGLMVENTTERDFIKTTKHNILIFFRNFKLRLFEQTFYILLKVIIISFDIIVAGDCLRS